MSSHSSIQVAFLAPTRILALQHLRVLQTRMPDVNIQLLRGGGKADALHVKEMIKNGECQVWRTLADVRWCFCYDLLFLFFLARFCIV
jgi:RecG-like helicase